MSIDFSKKRSAEQLAREIVNDSTILVRRVEMEGLAWQYLQLLKARSASSEKKEIADMKHDLERSVANHTADLSSDKLERLKIEAERWTAAVASDGSLAGSAAYELRHLIGQAHDLGLSARSAILPPTGSVKDTLDPSR